MRPRNASDSENLAASLALAEVRKGKHTPWGSWSYERGKQSLLFVVISFSYIYLRMITDIQLGHVPLYMCICVEGRGKLGELWVVGDVRSFDKNKSSSQPCASCSHSSISRLWLDTSSLPKNYIQWFIIIHGIAGFLWKWLTTKKKQESSGFVVFITLNKRSLCARWIFH